MTTNNAVNVTLSGQTGTGNFVGSTSPTLVTPTLGVATATSITAGNINIATNSIISSNTNGNIDLIPNGTGAVLFYSATSAQAASQGTVQTTGLAGSGSYVAASYFNGAGSSSTFWAYKSRSTTPGSFVAVQTNDTIGRQLFFGDDGAAFQQVAAMVVQAVGTISSGVVPGFITIQTANPSGVLTNALTISQNQLVTVAAINASSLTFSSTSEIIGTTTNNNAAAGSVGEFVSSVIANASAVSLSNNTSRTVTSISLTAGDWDLHGNISLNGGATTLLQYSSGNINTADNIGDPSLWNGPSLGVTGVAVFAENQYGYQVPYTRISLSGTTTVYLVVIAGFTTSTCTASGGIFARRVR